MMGMVPRGSRNSELDGTERIWIVDLRSALDEKSAEMRGVKEDRVFC
jgi:hypothetical protein